MTERIGKLREFFVVEKAHHADRAKPLAEDAFASAFAGQGLPDFRRASLRLQNLLALETPVIYPLERLVLTRRTPNIPALFTQEEMSALRQRHAVHERGEVCNICVDYRRLMDTGLEEKAAALALLREGFLEEGKEEQAATILEQIDILNAILAFCGRYRDAALRLGRTDVAALLGRVPRHAPQTFPEALQMFRILHFVMWLGGNYHNIIGRFDQFMYPWLRADLDAGRLTEAEALEWLEEFFLTFNRDSDLYPGMQQGDNGQSMMLGGTAPDGTDCYNLLSELCLKASLALNLIDPKINLRVNGKTPRSVYRLGSELTRQGLGFPQYSNDDVVIPALLSWGYEAEDAHDYVVAACWEFIIPGRGMDVPNIGAVSLAAAAQEATQSHLMAAGSFPELMDKVRENLSRQVRETIASASSLYIIPAPFLSLMMDGCSEQGRDISLGGRYNNYGIHGTGIATAVDALYAVQRHIYKEKTVPKARLLAALADDFRSDPDLLAVLRHDTAKMGDNNLEVDQIAVELLGGFADLLEGQRNDRGGIFRPGTGSAMYYLWHAAGLPATADGRRAGEPLSANYAPSLHTRIKGPVSIIQSFTRPDLKRVCNGGPLTLELHDTLFRNADAVDKVASLVMGYVRLGGHQLQLNAINREALLRAQQAPDSHRGLIVRVWGWSGYFVELDREYQDHIIARAQYTL